MNYKRQSRKDILVVILVINIFFFSGPFYGGDRASASIWQRWKEIIGNYPGYCKIIDSEVGPGKHYLLTQHDGLERTYHMYVPHSYNKAKATPLVIMMHAWGRDAQFAEKKTNFSNIAGKEGFIVVYPNGTGRLKNHFTWDSGYLPGYSTYNRIDDVGFIRSLIVEIEGKYNIDPKMIFVTGHSNGAMMAYRLGAELSNKIAAIASVSGSIGGKPTENSELYIIPKPSEPISVIVFHGKKDELVLYDGGEIIYGFIKIDLSVQEAISFWVESDNCLKIPQREVSNNGNIIIDKYTTCSNNTEVVLYTIKNGGHSWPGSKYADYDEPMQELSASEIIWDFFKKHPKK